MVAAPGEPDETDVAFQHDRLRRRRDAGKAEAGGELAFVHHAFADQIRILGVVDDERVEVACIGQRAAHHLRVDDASCPVGEGNGAGGLEQADLRHLVAVAALGQRRHGMDVDDGGIARAAEHEVDDRRVVDDRGGFGLADDGGDAAGGRGVARRGERLAVARAGFPDERAHVDQAGRHHLSAAIDGLGAFGHSGRMDAALGLPDHAVGDQEVAREVQVARRIDDPRVGEQDRTAVGEHRSL